jgi:predicted Fe-Mo cluster-binding NifX family protein
MKIAIPTRGNRVDEHFGHCEMYTVFSVDEKKQITGSESIASPSGCGCKSNIASVLREQGVEVMLAGNMGMGAMNVLNAQGIRVIRGCAGDATDIAVAYLNGQIGDSGISCGHHGHHHEGGQGHQCHHDE